MSTEQHRPGAASDAGDAVAHQGCVRPLPSCRRGRPTPRGARPEPLGTDSRQAPGEQPAHIAPGRPDPARTSERCSWLEIVEELTRSEHLKVGEVQLGEVGVTGHERVGLRRAGERDQVVVLRVCGDRWSL